MDYRKITLCGLLLVGCCVFPLLFVFVLVYLVVLLRTFLLNYRLKQAQEEAGNNMVVDYREFDLDLSECIEHHNKIKRIDTVALRNSRRFVAMALAQQVRAKLGLSYSKANTLVYRKAMMKLLIKFNDERTTDVPLIKFKDVSIVIDMALRYVFMKLEDDDCLIHTTSYRDAIDWSGFNLSLNK